jgi:hypothetical protein
MLTKLLANSLTYSRSKYSLNNSKCFVYADHLHGLKEEVNGIEVACTVLHHGYTI